MIAWIWHLMALFALQALRNMDLVAKRQWLHRRRRKVACGLCGHNSGGNSNHKNFGTQKRLASIVVSAGSGPHFKLRPTIDES